MKQELRRALNVKVVSKAKSIETHYCAFCHQLIEPNYFNACEDCIEQAEVNPEQFVGMALGV